jgi:hypothetical protein
MLIKGEIDGKKVYVNPKHISYVVPCYEHTEQGNKPVLIAYLTNGVQVWMDNTITELSDFT